MKFIVIEILSDLYLLLTFNSNNILLRLLSISRKHTSLVDSGCYHHSSAIFFNYSWVRIAL